MATLVKFGLFGSWRKNQINQIIIHSGDELQVFLQDKVKTSDWE